MNKRVLFFTQTASVHGGVERWLAELATGLARHGWEVEVALAEGPRFHRAERYLAAWPELARLPHRIVSAPSGLPGERREALERAIVQASPGVVVPVLLHETLAAATDGARGASPRIVYPAHENEPWCFEAIAQNAARLDGVVSVNRLMLDALEQWLGWPAERSFHVPCGVEFPDTAEPRFGGAGPVRLGYCGKLVQRPKRAGDLVGFCRRMRDLGLPFRLTIAGAGPEEAALRRDLAEEIATGRVDFLGWLDAASLRQEFYPAIDALLITSEWETGPLVAWEAMAHGALVLSSRYRGLRREGILRHGESALVFPVGEPGAAAELLASQLANRSRLAAVAARGRALAGERLGIEAMVEGWSLALRSTLAAPPREPGARLRPTREPTLRHRGEALLRRALHRPVRAGSSQEEWPRYPSGFGSEATRADFSRRLEALEDELSAEARRS